MKKLSIMSLIFFLALSISYAQSSRELDLKPFENIHVEGNIRIYLKQAASTKIVVETKDSDDFDEYRIEVEDGTLIVKHKGHSSGFNSTPKLTLKVEHPGLKELDMDGLVSMYAENTLKGESLRVKGDGMIRGDLDVIVDRLKLELDGMCKMTVVGRTKESDLSVTGMGKIDARGLRTEKLYQSTDGMASIKVGQ